MVREFRYCRPRRDPAETLQAYLAKKFTYLTQEEWGRHIAAGHVGVNGAFLKDGSYTLQQGDRLLFAPPRSLEPAVDEEHLEVLYEDETLVVVTKNGNLPVAEGGRYCENTLVALLRRRGTAAFYTASTIRPGSGASVSTDAVTAAGASREEDAGGEEPGAPALATSQGSKGAAAAPLPPTRRPRGESPHSSYSQGGEASYERGAGPTSDPPHPLAADTRPPFFTVHRLDKETSGIVALAKSSAAAKALASQLEEQSRTCTEAVEALVRERGPCAAFTSGDIDTLLSLRAQAVHKTYTAVLRGAAAVGRTFVVVNYMDCMAHHPCYTAAAAHARLKKLKMCCEPLNRTAVTDSDAGRELTAPASAGVPDVHWGKIAATRIRVLASDAHLDVTFVEVELLTGRSHQIRVHCAAVGYPVLGDKLYTTETPGRAGGVVAVSDEVYLERVRREDDPFVEVEARGGGPRDADHNVEGEGLQRGRLWCRRHLLHATRLSFPHHSTLASAPAMAFAASPVAFFVADVRFERPADALRFEAWLSTAALKNARG